MKLETPTIAWRCRKTTLASALSSFIAVVLVVSAGALETAGSLDQTHWSFQPVARPDVPAGFELENPVDAFIASKLAKHGLSLAPEADRRTLIRRLSFDLVGLPPMPEEVEEFVRNPNPQAYEQLVEHLLASPHYGERWGRHWLDVVGFAESSLFIGDQMRPGYWRYRDYVIRAFNADKPYDQFVTEQLAGDELFNWRATESFSAEQIDLLAATGFLRCPPDATDNQPITQEEKIFATQQSAMEVSIKALLGLTINCVRCHSHKYDPIPHEDYYRLIALFQAAYDPSNWVAGIWSQGNPGPIRAIPILDRSAREDYERRAQAWKSERRQLSEQINGGLMRRWRDRHLLEKADEIPDEAERQKLTEIIRRPAPQRSEDDENTISKLAQEFKVTREFLETNYVEFSNALSTARSRMDQIKKESETLPPVIWATYDTSADPSPTTLFRRGDYEQPAQKITPGVLSVLDQGACRFRLEGAPYPGTTGRRLALARWITNRAHPLTARVMVNRVWQYHFGAGLVTTPDDFGARGRPPSHPMLLDWLASEFTKSAWSVKQLHRFIVCSKTYRQSSLVEANSAGSRQTTDHSGGRSVEKNADTPTPESLLGHFPKRRIEAEAVRDSMLDVAGLLDRRLFGASVPTQRLPDGRNVVSTNSPDRYRRSVYLSTRRTTVPTMLTVFDAPSMDTNWPKRNDAVIPQQALTLMNNPFVLECAERFAQRILREGGQSFEGRLKRAFDLAYGRGPDSEELALFRHYAESQAKPSETMESAKTWTTISHALLSANEFLYLD